MFRKAMAVLAAGALALATGGCEETLTEENYNTIVVGTTTLDDVESMLGAGELQSAGGVSIDASGIPSMSRDQSTAKEYLWKEDGKEIVVRFEEGKVTYKRKSGF